MTTAWWPVQREGDLVRYLDDADYVRLLAFTEAWSVAPGEVVLKKGDPSASLLLVESGELEVVDDFAGKETVLAQVGPGGVVGEVGFVDGEPRTHQVRAGTEARLRSLSRDALLHLVRNDAALFARVTIALAELLARRFRLAVQELEPLRAFARSLREPDAADGASFDELEETAAPQPAAIDTEEVLGLLRDVARKSGSAGV